MKVSFKASAKDRKLIKQIVDRAMAMAMQHERDFDAETTTLDLLATHANGCPMDFSKLLAVEDFTFAHDVYGIRNCMDRETGRLRNMFRPRCAQKVAS